SIIWTHAFLWSGGVMIDLGTLGPANVFSEARSINNLGQVVGSSQPGPGQAQHAVLWDGGVATDLGVLADGDVSAAYGVNDAGQMVGTSRIDNNPYILRAFLWQKGQMFNLNELIDRPLPQEIILENARAIAQDGSIAGYTCNPVSFESCPAGAPPARAFL